MLEESMRSGEVGEIKTLRKPTASSGIFNLQNTFLYPKTNSTHVVPTETAAAGPKGLSPSVANCHHQRSTSNASEYSSSAVSSHLQSHSAQSPGYLPNATSSPQPYHNGPVCGYSSSMARSPLTTPAENSSGFYSPGLITSPTQRSKNNL